MSRNQTLMFSWWHRSKRGGKTLKRQKPRSGPAPGPSKCVAFLLFNSQRRLKRSFSACEKMMAGWRVWDWWMSRKTVPVELLVWNRNPREVKHDCNTVCQGLNIHPFVHTPQIRMCSAAPLWADTCLWFIPNIWNISMDNRKKKSLFVWDSGFALVSTCVRPSEV